MSLMKNTVPRGYPLYCVRLAPKIIVTAFCAAFASGCATDPRTGQPSFKETFASDDPCSHNARNIGIAVGGLIGAALGNQAQHSDKARLIGLAGGGLIGGLIGNDMDRHRCELSKIAKQHNLDIQFEDIKTTQVERTPDNQSATSQNKPGATAQAIGLKVSLKDDGRQFESGSDRLVPEARVYFQQIADQYVANLQVQKLEESVAMQGQGQQRGGGKAPVISQADKEKLRQHYNNIQIVLTGHTDDTGSSELNAKLAEERAKVVATLFTSRGVPEENLYFQGAGETQPIADNRTEEGRAKNRRVEILEIDSKEKLVEYLRSRKPNIEYYRPRQEEAQIAQNESAVKVESQVAFDEIAPAASKASGKATHKKASLKQSKQKNPKKNVANSESELVRAKDTSEHSGSIASAGKVKIPQAKNQFMEIDFGGVPADKDNGKDVIASFGELVGKQPGLLTGLSSFFVKEAQASPEKIYAVSCLKDSPRYSGEVVSLKTGKAVEYRTSEYRPGLYQTSWVSVVNGNYVGLTPVGVLRDSTKSVTSPDMLVYIGNDQPGNVKADFKSGTMTQAYQGTGGVLYRFYPAPKGIQSSVVCGDIVFPNKAPFEGRSGRIYYRKAGVIYSAEFKPRML